ncbi:hypothetical protein HERIO_2469 [Hepatospora eriocheir]|uniref:Uncharacterized protein n=1 Tax=Hepatospora eriocheir TaxID=1081669 RepID=A0A1X0Q6U3_9MICR|nr:hypothetical protein HERIO_2469 [Hepatospora eriocheir]
MRDNHNIEDIKNHVKPILDIKCAYKGEEELIKVSSLYDLKYQLKKLNINNELVISSSFKSSDIDSFKIIAEKLGSKILLKKLIKKKEMLKLDELCDRMEVNSVNHNYPESNINMNNESELNLLKY